MENVLGIFHNDCLPLLLIDYWGALSSLKHWGVPEGKPHNCVGTSYDCDSEEFLTATLHVNYHLIFPPSSQLSISGCTFFSRFLQPHFSDSLKKKKITNLFCSAFSHCKDKTQIFQGSYISGLKLEVSHTVFIFISLMLVTLSTFPMFSHLAMCMCVCKEKKCYSKVGRWHLQYILMKRDLFPE